MALVSSQLDLPFVRYAQNTEGWSWLWCCSLCQLVKFINNSYELFWSWIFVTNTCYMSSFICRWFRVNPIPGLRDIIEIPKVARNRAEQRKADGDFARANFHSCSGKVGFWAKIGWNHTLLEQGFPPCASIVSSLCKHAFYASASILSTPQAWTSASMLFSPRACFLELPQA